jgi:class 3 adenylate cyclase
MIAPGRLAAILAADVVGYSRLTGEDGTGTAKAVRERREASTPIVADLGGRFVKTTGDGLLLQFPSVVAARDRDPVAGRERIIDGLRKAGVLKE